jgi:hypothetical protein
VTALADACADIGEYLPRAKALITHPDTAPSGPGGKPGSRPPWNQAAANAEHDGLAVVADVHAMFTLIVTGRSAPRPPASATGRALAAIERLSHAVPDCHVRAAVRDLARCVYAVRVLAAVDEEELPRRVAAICPYCQLGMMRLYPRSGRVTCMRFGACFDENGRHPVGTAEAGRLGPCVVWADGRVS